MQLTIIPTDRENPPMAFTGKHVSPLADILEEWIDQLDGELKFFLYDNGKDDSAYMQNVLDNREERRDRESDEPWACEADFRFEQAGER